MHLDPGMRGSEPEPFDVTANVITTLLVLAHWFVVLGLSLRVIHRRSPVGVSVAWIAVMFMMPLVGAVMYLMIGERRLGRRRAALRVSCEDALEQWQRGLIAASSGGQLHESDTGGQLPRLAQSLLGLPPQPGNRLELLHDFNAVFDAMVADIDATQLRCDLCFYIWHGAGRTVDIVDALVRAAGRGVVCRVIADDLGSRGFLAGPQAARLRAAGVFVRAALPTGRLPDLLWRADLRNHRKIALFDDRIGYTGSQNMADPREFKQDAGAGQWVDAMVRIRGPAVAALAGVFALDWAVEGSEAFVPPPATHADDMYLTGAVVQVAPSGPAVNPGALLPLLLTAIYAARSEIVMTTPYFVPDEAIITALLSAARRGVAVTLVVPTRNDSRLVRYASVAHFAELLSTGARIALFDGGLLHTKSLAIDGRAAIFGSMNLDMRSIWLNFEVSLFVYDERFTTKLRALQDSYIAQSRFMDGREWKRRPHWRKFAEDVARLLGPLL